MDTITALSSKLDDVGKNVEQERKEKSNRKKIASKLQLEKWAPDSPGIYWIETNMPEDEMLASIKKTTGKEKKVRSTAPEGKGYCKTRSGYTMVYCGTQASIKSRLLEHLFNEGSQNTAKLGCKLEDEPFSKYGWFISYYELENTTLRYAIESWWRINVGWPKFCLR